MYGLGKNGGNVGLQIDGGENALPKQKLVSLAVFNDVSRKGNVSVGVRRARQARTAAATTSTSGKPVRLPHGKQLRADTTPAISTRAPDFL